MRRLLLLAGLSAALASLWLIAGSRSKSVLITVAGRPLTVDVTSEPRATAQMEAFARLLKEAPVVLAGPDGRWSYTAGQLGLYVYLPEFNRQVLAEVRGRGFDGQFAGPLPVRIDRKQMERAIEPITRLIDQGKRDATWQLHGETFVIQPHVAGRRVDREHLAALLTDWLAQGATETALLLPIAEDSPGVTTEAVERMGLRRLIAEATTAYDPKIPRAENVARAAAAFDGVLMKPGQILSYTGVVGPINAETGWKEAYVIVNGELVQGVGGGVCQVATTFYDAALLAGFEILERHPHQLAVPYVRPGLDAAVTPGFEDLKIRNTTPGYVLVKTEAHEGRVTFRLYGDLPAGREIRIESQVTGEIPYETVEFRDPELKRGARVVKSWGAKGYTAEAYRYIYDHGTLTSKELLSRDTYRPAKQVELIGH